MRQNLGEIGEAAVRATDAIAQEIVGLTAAAVDRIMTAAGAFDDPEQRVAEIRVQNRTLIDEQFSLDLDRVGRAIAVGWFLRVAAQKVNCLLAFEVDQRRISPLATRWPQGLPDDTTSSSRISPGGKLGSVIVSSYLIAETALLDREPIEYLQKCCHSRLGQKPAGRAVERFCGWVRSATSW